MSPNQQPPRQAQPQPNDFTLVDAREKLRNIEFYGYFLAWSNPLLYVLGLYSLYFGLKVGINTTSFVIAGAMVLLCVLVAFLLHLTKALVKLLNSASGVIGVFIGVSIALLIQNMVIPLVRSGANFNPNNDTILTSIFRVVFCIALILFGVMLWLTSRPHPDTVDWADDADEHDYPVDSDSEPYVDDNPPAAAPQTTTHGASAFQAPPAPIAAPTNPAAGAPAPALRRPAPAQPGRPSAGQPHATRPADLDDPDRSQLPARPRRRSAH